MNKILISGSDSKLALNWEKVVEVVFDFQVEGLKSLFGISEPGGLLDVFKGLPQILQADDTLESRAWKLVAMCLAKAIDDLRPIVGEDDARKEAHKGLAKAKEIIGSGDFYLEQQFFENPSSLPLYRNLREHIVEALSKLRPGTDDLGGQLDSAFNSALIALVHHDHDLVSELAKHISGQGYLVDGLEASWRSYRQLLVRRFFVDPLFGQEQSKVSLSQLYIEPRATWREQVTDEDSDYDVTVFHVVDLARDTLEWLRLGDPKRAVRLIRGGPGSGKSSFTKFIAAELASSADWRPMLIELQSLSIQSQNLREAIKQHVVDRLEAFDVDPLEKKYLSETRPIVLLFDGLDELVMPKSPGAQTVAEDFWDALEALLAESNSLKETRVFAIVTGRDAIVEAAVNSRGGRKVPRDDILSVVGLHAIDYERAKFSEDVDAGDQRALWWQKFANATGASLDPPPVLTGNQLETLTDEPLLCYLLALSGKAEESRQKQIENVNEVYDELLCNVWDRVWGELREVSETVTLGNKAALRRGSATGAFESRDDFEQILEYVAIAAWRDGESRTATKEEFEKAISHTRAETIWERFQESFPSARDGNVFSTLALTFFFRGNEGSSRGFEFTHRTFGEYLASRALVREIDRSVDKFEEARHTSALSDWVRLTSASEITPQILNFLQREFERKDVKSLQSICVGLENAMKIVLRDGMPIVVGSNDTWREAEQLQLNSEGALLACLSFVSVATSRRNNTFKPVSLGPSASPDYVSSLLARLCAPKEYFTILTLFDEPVVVRSSYNPLLECLSGIDFGERRDFSHLDLRGAAICKSVVKSSSFVCTDLEGSRVEETDLSNSFFLNTRLYRSQMPRSNFSNCAFVNSNFDRALLNEAIMVESKLENTKMTNCMANRVDFSRSRLHADLGGSSFRDANFFEADLTDARLDGADLSMAKGLTQEQIDVAIGDCSTKLPAALKKPTSWFASADSEN